MNAQDLERLHRNPVEFYVNDPEYFENEPTRQPIARDVPAYLENKVRTASRFRTLLG